MTVPGAQDQAFRIKQGIQAAQTASQPARAGSSSTTTPPCYSRRRSSSYKMQARGEGAAPVARRCYQQCPTRMENKPSTSRHAARVRENTKAKTVSFARHWKNTLGSASNNGAPTVKWRRQSDRPHGYTTSDTTTTEQQQPEQQHTQHNVKTELVRTLGAATGSTDGARTPSTPLTPPKAHDTRGPAVQATRMDRRTHFHAPQHVHPGHSPAARHQGRHDAREYLRAKA